MGKYLVRNLPFWKEKGKVRKMTHTYHFDGFAREGGSDFCILINTLIGCMSWFGGSI